MDTSLMIIIRCPSISCSITLLKSQALKQRSKFNKFFLKMICRKGAILLPTNWRKVDPPPHSHSDHSPMYTIPWRECRSSSPHQMNPIFINPCVVPRRSIGYPQYRRKLIPLNKIVTLNLKALPLPGTHFIPSGIILKLKSNSAALLQHFKERIFAFGNLQDSFVDYLSLYAPFASVWHFLMLLETLFSIDCTFEKIEGKRGIISCQLSQAHSDINSIHSFPIFHFIKTYSTI